MKEGLLGGDFEFLFNVLPGDAYGIDLLEYNNLVAIYQREGLDTNDAYYMVTGDIDGDGITETSDWQVVYNNLWASTPTGTPAGVTNDAPTTAGFAPVEIDNDAVDAVISLYDVFEDAEDSDSQLSYSIESNSDSSLFDSVSINATTGELIIDTLTSMSGRAEIVISATDQSGLIVEATLTVDVDRENVAPSILATVTDGGDGFWIIEGYVTDPDDDLDSMFVWMYGSTFFSRVSVGETGYFVYGTWLIPPAFTDLVETTTVDAQGADSNSVWVEIG